MDKFQNKYRIPSARAQWWDYGNNAAYFITICTQDRVHYFGEIVETGIGETGIGETVIGETVIVETRLIASLQSPQSPQQENEINQLAEQYWYEIPNHFPYVKLGAFIVMPNHIHGIIIIDKQEIVQTGLIPSVSVETGLIPSVQQPDESHKIGGFAGNKNPMLNENLSRIVRWYKGRCSFEIRKIQPDFKWQSRFHDHIIRNDAEYQRINDYIENNRLNWVKDKFYKKESV